MSHRTARALLLAVCAFAAVLAFPASGLAHSHGDRNRDGIPDRWEHAHRLSLKVNQAKRDQDHDGLRNKAEFRVGDNPRDADTDDDGVEDGHEKAGQVVSFSSGVLIVHLFSGDDVKGTVDADTELECRTAPDTFTARASDDGNRGDDEGDDDDEDDNDREDHHKSGCDATKLTTGATVGEAELEATPAGLVFEKIELVG